VAPSPTERIDDLLTSLRTDLVHAASRSCRQAKLHPEYCDSACLSQAEPGVSRALGSVHPRHHRFVKRSHAQAKLHPEQLPIQVTVSPVSSITSTGYPFDFEQSGEIHVPSFRGVRVPAPAGPRPDPIKGDPRCAPPRQRVGEVVAHAHAVSRSRSLCHCFSTQSSTSRRAPASVARTPALRLLHLHVVPGQRLRLLEMVPAAHAITGVGSASRSQWGS